MRAGWLWVVVGIGCGRVDYDPLSANLPGRDGGVEPLTCEVLPSAGDRLSLGYRHACFIEEDRTLWCWGDNEFSQLGLGASGPNVETPTQIGTRNDWAMVAGGLRHTCALTCGGEIFCWGENDQGQLGIDVTPAVADRYGPTLVVGGMRWARLAVQRNHTCAIAEQPAGQLWCWGSNGARQLGLGDNADRQAPTQVLHTAEQPGGSEEWAQLGPGDDHTCAIKPDQSLWCWGSNGNDQLGQAGAPDPARESPLPVVTTLAWQSTTGGLDSNCALDDGSELHCWGRNDGGWLGLGDLDDRDVPTAVEPGVQWRDVEVGYQHTCGIQSDGSLWCWGVDEFGELGLGPVASPVSTPTQVSSDGSWLRVRTSDAFSCAVHADTGIMCWGRNTDGRLGLGDTMSRDAPTAIGLD